MQTSSTRLPIAANLAALIAFVTLHIGGGGWVLLPFLALALLATYAVDARLDAKGQAVWMLRLLLQGSILVGAYIRFNADNGGDSAEMLLAHTAGQMCACELVLQSWLQTPLGGHRGAISVLLSCLVMMGASNTFDPGAIRFLVPAFMACLALSLPEFRTGGAPALRKGSLGGKWLALFLALGLGAGTHAMVWKYRFDLNQIGMKLLGEHFQPEAVGISTSPQLGATFDAERGGSLTRVLRTEGLGDEVYLRAMAFDFYEAGNWAPSADRRKFDIVTPEQLGASAGGKRAHIDRLVDDAELMFVPLHSAGIAPPPNSSIEWAGNDGGPLRSRDPAPTPFSYEIVLPAQPNYQGPLCGLSGTQRAAYLQLPPALDARVRALAQRIGGRFKDAPHRIEAVAEHLMTHHAYSLSTNPGNGDPVTNFLLEGKSAHCEYFASAAVLLLRCLRVPSRYVIGYYVHEDDGPGAAVVRLRDAHAWTECWVDGIGWVTVDATAGGGRPDQRTEPVGFWFKLREHAQDMLMAIRNGLARMDRRVLFGLCALALAALIARRLILHRRHRPKATSWAYSAGEADLEALALRFEKMMRRRGLAPPPYRTWAEHVEKLSADNHQRWLGVDVAPVRAFLTAYNNARWGQGATSKARETLELLEQTFTNQGSK